MRSENSSTDMNRVTSIAMKNWLTRIGLPLIRIPPNSRLMAPPLRTAHRISAIIARPYPLYPPSGIGQPSMAASVSVVGTPFGAMAHPGGIVGSPLMDALKILPIATVVVAMRSEEHTSELQSHLNLVCRLLLEKKKA